MVQTKPEHIKEIDNSTHVETILRMFRVRRFFTNVLMSFDLSSNLKNFYRMN